MSNVDIVARLQLRADQFSSETGRAFHDISTRAKAASTDVRQSFNSAFAEVQRLAQSAPKTAGGGIDLTGEIAGLERAAAAADQRSESLRNLSIAQTNAARAAGVNTQAMLLEADAAAAASIGEDRAADELRQRVVQMRAVQVESDRLFGSTVRVAEGHKAAASSAGAQRAAMQGLSFQAQDAFTQISMGTNVMSVAAIQGGQLAGQFANIEGAAGNVARFMIGPWGLAFTGALLVAGAFGSKLFETNNALEDEVKKLRKSAEQTDLAAKTKAAYARTTDGVIAKLREQIDVTQKLIAVQRTAAEAANITAKQEVDNGQRKRDDVARQLQAARDRLAAQVARASGGGDRADVAALGIVPRQKEVTRLERELARLDAGIKAGQQSIERSRLALAAERAKDAGDTGEQIDKRFDAEVAALKARTARAVTEGKVVGAATQRAFEEIEARRTAAHEKERKRQQERLNAEREIGKASASETATPASVVKMLRAALPGVQVTSTTGGKHVNGSDHYAKRAIDFVPAGGMGSMSKADVRELFESRGLNIRRNARGVEQLFGPGDKDHSDHFHVAWEKGKAALDNYTTSRRDATKADRDAAAELRELDQLYGSITSALDPSQAALDEFRSTIAEIDKLVAAGRIGPAKQFEYRAAAGQRFDNAQTQIREQGRQGLTGFMASGTDDLDKILGNIIRERDEAFEESVVSAGERFREAIGSAGDLFGIRVSGPLSALLQPGGIGAEAKYIAENFERSLRGVGINLSKGSVEMIGAALQGAVTGQAGSSVFASITGGKSNPMGAAIGGAFGEIAGKELGKLVPEATKGLLGTLGGAAGPIGSIVGGIMGSVVSGLFAKAPKAGAGIDVSDGKVGGGKATGSGVEARSGAATLAGSVASALNQIADLLGARVTGATDVQIGMSNGNIHVNDRGGQIGKKGSGDINFEGDQAGAIAFAVSGALKDGVLSGISAASLKILQGGKDLQQAINKALSIEAIPKNLKAILDPVGAALDTLNTKWAKTIEALTEGGASAEQMADAQRLYNLEVEQTKSSTAAAAQSLKDYLTELKGGSNSPYSLRTQEANALGTLKPFLEQIDQGKSIDQGKYQAAAQTYLDVSRQLYGSTKAYFDAFDSIQASTTKAIAAIEHVAPITPAVPDPFTKATADAAAKTALAVQTGNEMTADTNELLQRLVKAVEGLGGDMGDTGFIGSDRAFLAA